MSEFTVDAADIALQWLSKHRDLWAGAYCVTIKPTSYSVGADGNLHPTLGRMTVISVQGNDLTLPDGADGWGPIGKNGLRSGLLIVSDDLAVEFCTRLSSDADVERVA